MPKKGRRVAKLNKTSEIASWIRAEINSGAYPPGAKLEERSLSKKLGVSKTPVREALIKLASDGLVEFMPQRGATVVVRCSRL
jgi:DNA-binding GntR family transcriptional regulator